MSKSSYEKRRVIIVIIRIKRLLIMREYLEYRVDRNERLDGILLQYSNSNISFNQSFILNLVITANDNLLKFEILLNIYVDKHNQKTIIRITFLTRLK